MEHIVELDNIVTGFNISEHCIDCMCGKIWLKLINTPERSLSKASFCERRIFKKTNCK